MYKKLSITLIVLSILVTITPAYSQDLTGVWNCDDGGKYYIRQIGNEVFWYGEKAPTGPQWSNIAFGVKVGDTIILKWVDVPKGAIMGKGELHLRVISPNKIQAVMKTGGFGGSNWSK